MQLTQEIFLDLCSLSITETTAQYIDRRMIHNVLLTFHDYATKTLANNEIFDVEENTYYLQMLKELIDDSHTYSDTTRLNIFVSKYTELYPNKNDKHFGRLLSNILLAKEDLSDEHVGKTYKRVQNLLATYVLEADIGLLRYKARKINESFDSLTQSTLIDDICRKGREMLDEVKAIIKPAAPDINAEFIAMNSKESVLDALRVNRLTRTNIVFKPGLKAIEEWLEHGGFTLGESVMVGGITGNYKSGMMSDFVRWLVSYSKPPKLDGRKPLILHISLEDEANKNLVNWYKRTYFIETGKSPGDDVSDEEIAKTIIDVFGKNGWEVHTIRKTGGFFGFADFVKLCEEYKKEGYHVVATIIDYMALMKLDTGSDGNRITGLQVLARNFTDYAKSENMLFVSGQQLNPAATAIASSGVVNPIKKFSYYDHFAECKGIAREFDHIFFVHVEKGANKKPYLTLHWGKSRGQKQPDADIQFAAYPFSKHGIIDDINAEVPGYVRDIFKFSLDGNQESMDEFDESIFN